jgi:hypothetical protein
MSKASTAFLLEVQQSIPEAEFELVADAALRAADVNAIRAVLASDLRALGRA